MTTHQAEAKHIQPYVGRDRRRADDEHDHASDGEGPLARQRHGLGRRGAAVVHETPEAPVLGRHRERRTLRVPFFFVVVLTANRECVAAGGSQGLREEAGRRGREVVAASRGAGWRKDRVELE
ncbi:hypothetical protein HIM_07931 [Hirsutella minnesotensis 3608]|uniref:Uncharacterized protein n=1 Tax=Hirsutella minnesotensis 3608 TaxID=1043627 RepID=A0A0F8A405_9HYPO|nr:hypothetical protein HIM_07931 [Hirsutella minnesotensis 3608]